MTDNGTHKNLLFMHFLTFIMYKLFDGAITDHLTCLTLET